jgi:hypothetical protein
VPEEVKKNPVYTGIKMYPDKTGGYGVWVPSDWTEYKLKRNQRGMLFSPYKDDLNTSLLVRKYKLKVTVTQDDLPLLRESFIEGIQALPGAEIESTEESLSESINVFDARFTFLEGENRRKRWVRNIYWGNGQLVLIAQGRTPEDFEYWLPMFYNTMMTTELL